jgi:hypothetical protein
MVYTNLYFFLLFKLQRLIFFAFVWEGSWFFLHCLDYKVLSASFLICLVISCPEERVGYTREHLGDSTDQIHNLQLVNVKSVFLCDLEHGEQAVGVKYSSTGSSAQDLNYNLIKPPMMYCICQVKRKIYDVVLVCFFPVYLTSCFFE